MRPLRPCPPTPIPSRLRPDPAGIPDEDSYRRRVPTPPHHRAPPERNRRRLRLQRPEFLHPAFQTPPRLHPPLLPPKCHFQFPVTVNSVGHPGPERFIF